MVKKTNLGPLKYAWDAWTEVEASILKLPADHFQTTLLTQILEVREALALDNKSHAAEEVCDIISVALNWLRSLGLTEADIAKVLQSRSEKRYVGQAAAIMRKYQKRYGI